MHPIRKISIRGYKSIRSLDSRMLTNLNVLVGANGAGKSNFISFFRLLARLTASELNYYVAKNGGPDAFLHYGRKRTPRLEAEMYFGNNGYELVLEPTQGNGFVFGKGRTGTTSKRLRHRSASWRRTWRPASLSPI